MKKLNYDDFATCVVALVTKKEVVPMTFGMDELQIIKNGYENYAGSKKKLEKALKETVKELREWCQV